MVTIRTRLRAAARAVSAPACSCSQRTVSWTVAQPQEPSALWQRTSPRLMDLPSGPTPLRSKPRNSSIRLRAGATAALAPATLGVLVGLLAGARRRRRARRGDHVHGPLRGAHLAADGGGQRHRVGAGRGAGRNGDRDGRVLEAGRRGRQHRRRRRDRRAGQRGARAQREGRAGVTDVAQRERHLGGGTGRDGRLAAGAAQVLQRQRAGGRRAPAERRRHERQAVAVGLLALEVDAVELVVREAAVLLAVHRARVEQLQAEGLAAGRVQPVWG